MNELGKCEKSYLGLKQLIKDKEYEIASGQAREKVLRDQFEIIANYWNDDGAANKCNKAMDKARDLPFDNTALKQLLAAERERVAKYFDGKDEQFGDTVADAIRALGD